MAQTGEIKWVSTAGLPSVTNTGEIVWHITAGIPNAYTAAAGGKASKNTHSFPLGVKIGEGIGLCGYK